MIFFRRVFSTTYLKMRQFFASTFFDIYRFLKTQRLRVIMIASQPRSVLCVHAPLRFLKSKKFHGFCADLFRRYSQLPAKPKFGQIKCNHTIDISKNTKTLGTTVVINFYRKPLQGRKQWCIPSRNGGVRILCVFALTREN